MTEQGVDTLTGDDFKITWKSVQSSRFDSKKFKADHADIYAMYTRKTETKRFVLAWEKPLIPDKEQHQSPGGLASLL